MRNDLLSLQIGRIILQLRECFKFHILDFFTDLGWIQLNIFLGNPLLCYTSCPCNTVKHTQNIQKQRYSILILRWHQCTLFEQKEMDRKELRIFFFPAYMVSYFIIQSSSLNEIQNADYISQRNPAGTLKGAIANINIKSPSDSKYNTPITLHLFLFSRNTGKILHTNVRYELIAIYLILAPTKNSFIHNSLHHSTLSSQVVKRKKRKKELIKNIQHHIVNPLFHWMCRKFFHRLNIF